DAREKGLTEFYKRRAAWFRDDQTSPDHPGAREGMSAESESVSAYHAAPMGKTREIKKRIKAVGNIRRITNTMRMIATSKFARAQIKATATKPYTEGIFELVREIAGNLA